MICHIYKIICRVSNITYVGATTQSIRNRWKGHKMNYKQWLNGNKSKTTIFPYYMRYGIENFQIVLIKSYDVVDRTHLSVYEHLWIYKFRKTCVNKQNPFKISSLTNKLYYIINRETLTKRLKTKFDCYCGGKYTYRNKKQHLKTIKHQMMS